MPVASSKKAALKRKVLAAALTCSGGDQRKDFSFEDLLVQAWREDPSSWGLRGYEDEHPDPERLHREVDSRGKGQEGLVGTGMLKKVETRVYRLTPKGMVVAASAAPDSSEERRGVERTFEGEVRRIIEHPVFVGWLKEPSTPGRFREAGRFWGVAAGMPPGTVRERVSGVEDTLNAALELLEERDAVRVGRSGGKSLYEREDIVRALDFQEAMKRRFVKDLQLLLGA